MIALLFTNTSRHAGITVRAGRRPGGNTDVLPDMNPLPKRHMLVVLGPRAATSRRPAPRSVACLDPADSDRSEGSRRLSCKVTARRGWRERLLPL